MIFDRYFDPPEVEDGPFVCVCVRCGYMIGKHPDYKICPACKDLTDFVTEEEYDKSLGEPNDTQ